MLLQPPEYIWRFLRVLVIANRWVYDCHGNFVLYIVLYIRPARYCVTSLSLQCCRGNHHKSGGSKIKKIKLPRKTDTWWPLCAYVYYLHRGEGRVDLKMLFCSIYESGFGRCSRLPRKKEIAIVRCLFFRIIRPKTTCIYHRCCRCRRRRRHAE